MKKEDLKNHIKQSIKLFNENDLYLLDVNVNERTLTHKFAEYLQLQVGNSWSVDCEYNRNLGDIKIINAIKQHVGEVVPTDDTEAKSIYPDIIIHRRNSRTDNLLVIEAKKVPINKKNKDKDISKLTLIKNQLNYSYAVFLEFNLEQKNIDYKFIN